MRSNLQVVILAGGLGTRIRASGTKIPKSLVKVWGKPFLLYQLELLREAGIYDIVLCIGYLGEQIEERFGDGRNFGIKLRYSYDGDKLLGTAGALKNAENLLGDKFFVMYGDSYLRMDYQGLMGCSGESDKLGLMAVYKNYDKYGKSNVAVDGNSVKEYSKEKKTENMVYIDYGVSILKKQTLGLIPYFSHILLGQPYPLDNLFAKLISMQELLAYEVKKRFYEIGSPKGLADFAKYIKGKK